MRRLALVPALAVAAAAVLQLVSAAQSQAIPVCNPTESVEYAWYGYPVWTNDRFVSGVINNPSGATISRQVRVDYELHYAITFTAEFMVGQSVSSNVGFDIKATAITLNMAHEFQVRYGAQLQVDYNHGYHDSLTVTLPPNTGAVVIKAGLVIQTIQQKLTYRDENCNYTTTYGYLNIATEYFLSTSDPGALLPPAGETRSWMGVGNVNLRQIDPLMIVCSGAAAARREEMASAACQPSYMSQLPADHVVGTVRPALGDSLDGTAGSEVISKTNGILTAYRNNGYNSNGTVNWGSPVVIGNGWGMADDAVYFADLDGDRRSDVISKTNGILNAYRNNGYNSNGTVNWGSPAAVGNGWGMADDAVKFA